jgi:DnaJ-class molecular chaperone
VFSGGTFNFVICFVFSGGTFRSERFIYKKTKYSLSKEWDVGEKTRPTSSPDFFFHSSLSSFPPSPSMVHVAKAFGPLFLPHQQHTDLSSFVPQTPSISQYPPTTPPPSTTSQPKASTPLDRITRGGWQRPKGSSANSQYGESSGNETEKKQNNKNKGDDDDEDFYEILGCTRTATEKELTRAYRKACVKHHPDKTNGDRARFDEISLAYDTLNDPVKRKLYDRFGKRSLEPNFNPGMGSNMGGMFGGGMQGGMFGSHEDILRAFFNQQERSAPRRARDVRYNLDVSLKDLYSGAEKRVQIAKPTMNGISELVTLKVEIARGTRGNSKVRLRGEIDHVPKAEPGDVVFVINEVPDERFTRKNDDLATTLEVSFAESLTGFKKEIRHLDGRVVRVAYSKGVKNGDVLRIDNEGMPRRGGGFGRLYIVLDVKMGMEVRMGQEGNDSGLKFIPQSSN